MFVGGILPHYPQSVKGFFPIARFMGIWDVSQAMSKLTDRINELLKQRGISAAAASVQAGFSPSYIRDLNRKRGSPGVDNLEKLARVLGVSLQDLTGEGTGRLTSIRNLPVVGVVQAGNFRDISLLDGGREIDVETIPVAEDPRYPYAKQYALKVAGDSMDKLFNDGDYVTCVDWADCGLSFVPGMILHVERVIGGSLVETTVKRFARRDGRQWLDPDSHNPKHQPIEINGSEDTEIIIRGLVTGSWRTIGF